MFVLNFIYLFIFGCAGFSLQLRLFSSCCEWASHCGRSSCCRAQAPGHVGSVVAVPGLQSAGSVAVVHGAQLLHSMWDLPRSEVEPMSSTFAGGFFTTESPEKP